MRMFGLSRAEARLAEDVGVGRRLDCLADEHPVRRSTLRTQVRDTARQGQGDKRNWWILSQAFRGCGTPLPSEGVQLCQELLRSLSLLG